MKLRYRKTGSRIVPYGIVTFGLPFRFIGQKTLWIKYPGGYVNPLTADYEDTDDCCDLERRCRVYPDAVIEY